MKTNKPGWYCESCKQYFSTELDYISHKHIVYENPDTGDRVITHDDTGKGDAMSNLWLNVRFWMYHVQCGGPHWWSLRIRRNKLFPIKGHGGWFFVYTFFGYNWWQRRQRIEEPGE